MKVLARLLPARRAAFHDFAIRNGANSGVIRAGLRRVLGLHTLNQLQEYVADFERSFAQYLGVAHAISQASGTSALQLALRRAEVGPGTEVVTVANTWATTLTAVHALGGQCRFVDIDPYTGLMDTNRLEKAITSKTVAILPVHMYGSMAPMREIMSIARSNGIHVIEDACQAIGAELDGRPAGSWGYAGCFSFHATKLVGAPCDGGMVVTDDDALAESLRSDREVDWSLALVETQPCVPSRLSPLAVPFLKANLGDLRRVVSRRQEQVAFYQQRLQGVRDVRLLVAPENVSSSHRNCILISPHKAEILATCQAKGLPVEEIYPALPQLVERLQADGCRLSFTETLARDNLALPLGDRVGRRMQARVIEVIRRASSTPQVVVSARG
ncbi:MAG: aminotransferase class V-fold PLP-dependent enzyme [Ketobacter sp.]|nr:aminotransferase class V-fold PLP-dependent enzyme [Ketobacter sp.]